MVHVRSCATKMRKPNRKSESEPPTKNCASPTWRKAINTNNASCANHAPSVTVQPRKSSSPPEGNPESATLRQQIRNPNAKQKHLNARAPKMIPCHHASRQQTLRKPNRKPRRPNSNKNCASPTRNNTINPSSLTNAFCQFSCRRSNEKLRKSNKQPASPMSSCIRPRTSAPACTCMAALACKDKETSCLVSLRLLAKKCTV